MTAYHTPLCIMVSSPSEPSRAASGMRPPLASADASSIADSLPNINFGFEGLRDRMAQFTTKFDAAIAHRRKQFHEDRDQFHVKLTELQGMTKSYSVSRCITSL